VSVRQLWETGCGGKDAPWNAEGYNVDIVLIIVGCGPPFLRHGAPIDLPAVGVLIGDRNHPAEQESVMEITFSAVIPILRIFDIPKAEAFYQGFLGFSVDWDHRFDPDAPLYRQVSRGNLILHLSEHHGDGSPGASIRVMMQGVEAFHREISAKFYRYMRPGIETTEWGTLEMGVIDPFGNLIRFCQPIERPQ
jgi:catechol 2,3-dioxygenase-like lactoylglutathione lyase family enzyme